MLNASSVADALRQANYQHPAFSASAILGYDRSGEFNTEAESVASRAGLGELLANWVESPGEVSLDSLTASMGELCRQDLSLGLGYCLTAFMAATNLAVAGSAAQKARVANVLRNDQRIAIAYHELHAGNDLSALALKATKVDGGYALSGCKEVVNNLTRAKAVVLFADTGEENPARHHSLFLLTEEELSQTGVTVANRFNTLGVRNCHIMGIAFDDVFVPEHCLLGEQGRGGEYALKAFQITRTLLPAISQYALRNGLDLLTRFACQRKLYNGDLFEMPVYRKAFTEAAADTWLAGETATLMRHGLEAFPQFGNGYSAAAKFYLPRVMKKALKSMSGLLGARYYLSSDDYGLFEKLVRDFPVVSFGHAGSLVCQTTLVHQLPRLLQPSGGETAEHDLLAGNRDWLGSLRIACSKGDPILGLLPVLTSRCEKRFASDENWRALLADISPLMERCHGRLTSSPYDAAEDYCRLVAVTAVLRVLSAKGEDCTLQSIAFIALWRLLRERQEPATDSAYLAAVDQLADDIQHHPIDPLRRLMFEKTQRVSHSDNALNP